jgi:L,D-transpeptidase YcbB
MRVATISESLKISSGTRISRLKSVLNNTILLTKYIFLLGLIFLLAGYDAANPKIGNTTVEFFSSEFRTGLQNIMANNEIDTTLKTMEDHLITEFYDQRQNMPAWTLNFEANEGYHSLHNLLNSAWNYGLIPAQYSISKLEELESFMTDSDNDDSKLKARIEFEFTATQSALRFITHLSTGFRGMDTTSAYITFCHNLPVYLNSIINKNDLRQGILELQPDNREYVRLQNALHRYLCKADTDTLNYSIEELQNNNKLVIDRLCKQGFLDSSFMNDSAAVQSALENFQQAHNIEQTGELSQETLIALTLSTKDKFNKIALNLDRLRKDELNSKNYILVNIPEFRLHYYNPAGELQSFNVVVGKTFTPTPIITSKIERIVANPYWTVPKSITFNEFIPKIKKDSLYLQKHGYSVIDKYENPVDASQIDWNNVKRGEFDYWIRQPNGGRNALGSVKFLFPNKYSVYLHDTPSKRLFNRKVRAFSHGCIRVQNPEDLAQCILQDYYINKNEKKVDFKNIVGKNDRVELELTESLPVYIRYYTCTADTLGNISYYPDIYKKDDTSMEEIMAYLSSN